MCERLQTPYGCRKTLFATQKGVANLPSGAAFAYTIFTSTSHHYRRVRMTSLEHEKQLASHLEDGAPPLGVKLVRRGLPDTMATGRLVSHLTLHPHKGNHS